MKPPASAAALRERLGHPVIDGDGHTVEHLPALDSYVRAEGLRNGLAEAFPVIYSAAERRDKHVAYMSPLTLPAQNTRDLATAMLPGLMYERLPELGIDFAMIFPTIGQSLSVVTNEDVRRGTCRALNNYMADMFGDFRDRLCPVGVIPMYSPEEAVEELEFVVKRGLKSVMIGGYAVRPTVGEIANSAHDGNAWLDTFGLDSEHDYDPFWARCVDLGIAPSVHAIGMGIGTRRSPSNYVYNQIGHFASTGEAITKSLFLGGVTYRFPNLRFGILEAGIGWATSLYADLVNRWEKRNASVISRYYKSNVDRSLYNQLQEDFAPELARFGDPLSAQNDASVQEAERIEDDFVRCGIARVEDIKELFVERFFFGCETDDPTTRLACDRSYNPLGAELHAIFSSDIGHWDVPDMTAILGEAYELLEYGFLDRDQFEDFTLRNVVRFYTAGNPRFFEGTAVAHTAAAIVNAETSANARTV